jgi:hypothetical protein
VARAEDLGHEEKRRLRTRLNHEDYKSTDANDSNDIATVSLVVAHGRRLSNEKHAKKRGVRERLQCRA